MAPATDTPHDPAVYRDPTAPAHERVADLVGRMTLQEKASQVTSPFGTVVNVFSPPATGFGTVTAALSPLGLPPRETAERRNELQRFHVERTRLGIPVIFAEESLVGLKLRDATTYPDPIAQASTWDPDLVGEIGRAIGAQMTTMGVSQAYAPLADVARDPRWGRLCETYGEEPFLVAAMATSYVQGLQGAGADDSLSAVLKHFVAYSGSEGGRNGEAVQLGPRELHEVHGRGFERAIRDGGARGVMSSYNTIDGSPVTGSPEYLTGLLREEYGFTGLVVSDLGAVSQLQNKHRTARTLPEAAAQALRAGVDIDLENRDGSTEVLTAVEQGLLREEDLDRAVSRILELKIRMGLFENPYIDIERVPDTLDGPDTRALARRAAVEAFTLLKNDPVDGAPILPLRPGLASIAVIGPNAHRPIGQVGHYSYHVLDSITHLFAEAADPQIRIDADEELAAHSAADDAGLRVTSVPLVTFLDAIRERAGEGTEVLYEPGCPIDTMDRSGIPAAVEAARRAEVAIVVVGDQAGINGFGNVGEGLDGTTLELPPIQRELVEAVSATGTPTAVLLSHGRPYVLDWMTRLVPAIATAWFSGEEAGPAAASILFGDESPAGRLPVSLLRSAGAAPIPYWRTPGVDVYVDGSSRALFPLGHGLSYTSFEYSRLTIESAEVPTDGVIRFGLTVTNTGDVRSDEVVQVYGQDVHARSARPDRVLLALQRLSLEAGQSRRIAVEVPADLLALWDPHEGWLVEPGEIHLFVGASSQDIRLTGRVELTGRVHLTGADRALGSAVDVLEAEQ